MKYEIEVYCQKCKAKKVHMFAFVDDDHYRWMCGTCHNEKLYEVSKDNDRRFHSNQETDQTIRELKKLQQLNLFDQ